VAPLFVRLSETAGETQALARHIETVEIKKIL